MYPYPLCRFAAFGSRLGRRLLTGLAVAALLWVSPPSTQLAEASSHREAPAITRTPKVDGTDFYMFRSTEAGRADYVTIIACYQPLQDPYGGPNYFDMDPDALYEIHVDNNGDAKEDITFQFRFQTVLRDLALDIGAPGATKRISVPLRNIGPFSEADTSALNVEQSYTVNIVRGDRRTGTAQRLTQLDGTPSFVKPSDHIGTKSIPDYATYASAYKYDMQIPGCPTPGRVFVGQRKDPFVVNLGETFDLINTNPLGPENAEQDDLADKNVTCFCLEIPIACLTNGDDVIGAWTTASVRQARVLNPEPNAEKKTAIHGGAWTQVSRLAMPLVNEVVIGLKDKDRFNRSHPSGDAQFLDYVTHPSLPELIEVLFPVSAPDLFPRQDLVDVFLLGVTGLNRPASPTPSEMLRLNTATAPVAQGSQNRLGVIGGDTAGYPNGRRLGDDIVDISLRVVMGVLLGAGDAPNGQLAYTDGAFLDDTPFDATFPYVRDPIPGSPN